MSKPSLIFPMAGQGARFGYRFKPFLEVRGETFIECRLPAPSGPWLAQIDRTSISFSPPSRTGAHDVRAHGSGAMFADVPHDTAILPAATPGPAETLRQCLEMKAIAGPILVCDCDHAVNVDALIQAARRPGIACAVPTWNLAGESLAAWSVASVDDNGLIGAVAEKALPARGTDFRGMIGCYYFADAEHLRRCIADAGTIYISDIICGLYMRQPAWPVLSVPRCDDAHFFGDPARLARVTAR